MLWALLSIPGRWWNAMKGNCDVRGEGRRFYLRSYMASVGLEMHDVEWLGVSLRWNTCRASQTGLQIINSLAYLGPKFELCEFFRLQHVLPGTSSAPWRARTRRSASIALWKDVWLGPQGSPGSKIQHCKERKGPCEDRLGCWTSWSNKERLGRWLYFYPESLIVLYCTDCQKDWLTPSATAWAIITKAMRGHATALDVQRQLFESSLAAQLYSDWWLTRKDRIERVCFLHSAWKDRLTGVFAKPC